MSHKIYHIHSHGFVEERGQLGKMIAELARTELQTISFYTRDLAAGWAGGSTEIFLECSEALAAKIAKNPLCASIVTLDPSTAVKPAPAIDAAFKKISPTICIFPKPPKPGR